MQYRREFEPVLRRPIASQESVPSSAYWRQKAFDLEDQAAQEEYEREMENWYLQNRGVVQPDGSYFGPELGAMPDLEYNSRVRQVGQPMRRYEAYPEYDERLMENVGDLVLGYDPREGAEGYFERPTNEAETALFGAAFAPGKVGRTAGALLGADIAYDIVRGRRIPGAIDVMWLGGLGARGARNIYRAGKAFGSGFKAGRARRATEQAMRARSLNAPKVRMQNARTGRWDEVPMYIEEVPYEEVRF